MQSDLQTSISGLRRRVRLLLVERYGLYGAGIGVSVAALLVTLSHRIPDLIDPWLWAVTALSCAIIGVVLAFLRRVEDIQVAVSADRRAGLKERVSTAVLMEALSEQGDMEKALIADAEEHVGRISAKDVFPHRWGPPHMVFGISILFLLCTLVLPGLHVFQSKTRQQEIAVMKAEGQKLVEVAKEIRKEGAGAKREDLRRLAARVEKLGKQMQSGRMEKKQAMVKAKQLSDQVKAEQDRLAAENSKKKSMEQAQEEMRASAAGLAAKMAQSMGEPQQGMKKLPSDKRLAELARKSGSLTPRERLDIQKALEKYADAKNSDAIPAELGDALAKLAANKDYRKAAEIMQKLAQKMQNGKMKPMDREALKQQMKALAKALRNTDLDQLAKQMRDSAEALAKMSPEELDKLIKKMEENERMASSLKKAGST